VGTAHRNLLWFGGRCPPYELWYYTIGIAPGRPGSTFEMFVSRLAEQNWGRYRRLEQ
jgi:hypothetical protein